MKRMLNSIFLILSFIETYLILSFFIPSLKIKLIAPPLEYFLKSISSTYLFKIIISLLVVLLLSLIYLFLKRRKIKINTKIMGIILGIGFIIIFTAIIYSLNVRHF